MSIVFPTGATGTSQTSTPTTSSGLFSGPTTTSNSGGGGGWFGAGGGGGSTSAYFQTVIISLVALAVLLIISVAFLYYRRRRMRLYSAADWPFHDRTLGGAMFFPGSTQGGRNKDSKELGEKPEMWQVLLDDEDERVGVTTTSANGSIEKYSDGMGMSGEERERQEEEVLKHGEVTRWQPLSVVSLTTHQASVPASSTNNQNDGETVRPTSMFNRGFSSHAVNSNNNRENHNTSDGDQPGNSASMTATTRTDGTPGSLPIHLTFLIAMPQPPSTRPPPVRSAYDEDEGEDIPEVTLGTTVIELDLPSDLTGSNSGSSPTYPPPHQPTPNSPVSRHTSLGHVLGLTPALPEQGANNTTMTTTTSGGNSTALSLRDVLGLPAPVQRTRRERRREREMIGVR